MDEEAFIGEIVMFGGNFAPRSWAFCDGQLLAINQNQALFSILGTTYGGDGRTTFGLPDLRGRAAMHAGTGPGLSTRQIGQKSGTWTNTLTINHLANHNHLAIMSGNTNIPANTGNGNTDDPSDAYPAGTGTDFFNGVADATGAPLDTSQMNPVVGANGNQQPVNNMGPYLGVRYVICLQGLFPSRN